MDVKALCTPVHTCTAGAGWCGCLVARQLSLIYGFQDIERPHVRNNVTGAGTVTQRLRALAFPEDLIWFLTLVAHDLL